MNIKQAIYELRTRFKNMFITRTTQATVTINANTNARVNATIPTVNGYKPIAIKGLKNSNGTDGAITEFSVYSDTLVTSVIRNVSSTQKSFTITYEVLYVKEIFGGGITLAIQTLSALLRGCCHACKRNAISDFAENENSFSKNRHAYIEFLFLQERKSSYLRFKCTFSVKPNISMGDFGNVATRILSEQGYTSTLPLGEIRQRNRLNTNQNRRNSKRICKFTTKFSTTVDCIRLFSGLTAERGCVA